MSEKLQQYIESAVIRQEDNSQVIELPARGSVESAVIELSETGELDEIGKSIAWIQIQRIMREIDGTAEINEVEVGARIKKVISNKLIGS